VMDCEPAVPETAGALDTNPAGHNAAATQAVTARDLIGDPP